MARRVDAPRAVSPLLSAPPLLAAFRRALLKWFRASARDLPWRRDADPYRVWLSEIMLQQTRVETVIPYFERFLAAFPTVQQLAAADEADVLRLWAGLGYYSRARNLHAAARDLVEEYDGQFPRTAADLQVLPGIGRYTAAAIASICFGDPVAVLDGNVKRVLARLFADRSPINDATPAAHFWILAQSLLDATNSGDFNQAMMELGATICTPTAPRCLLCPVRQHCAAQQAGIVAELPVVKAKSPPRTERRAAAAMRRRGDGAVLLTRRGERGLLHGMWKLPDIAVDAQAADNDAAARAALGDALRKLLGCPVTIGRRLGEVEHVFTHRRWFVAIHEVTADAARTRLIPNEARWLTPSQLDEVPLSTLDRKTLAVALDSPPQHQQRTKRAARPASSRNTEC